MIVFLIVLILAMVVIGLYAAQNTGTHDITLWNTHWTGVADWVPVVLAAGVVVVLFVLYTIYAGARTSIRHGALRRRITTHESTISELRKENQRLREDNARLKSQLHGQPMAPAQPSAFPQTPVGVSAEAHAWPGEAPPDTAQPSLGERVRAFLTGRETAG
jgi:hypothetical protein